MGYAYFKRPLSLVSGLIMSSTGDITADQISGVTVSGSSNVVASKGFKEGAVETRTTLAQLTLLTYGLSFIDASTAGTSATRAFTLGPPPAAGVHKFVVLKQNANTTRVISLATTADHYNSTRNSYQTVTGKARNQSQYAWHFVGTTAGTWAVVSQPLLSSALTYT